MLRVDGYIRVSTDDQSISIDAQRDKVVTYARLYELELREVVADDGVSAKSLDRPGLNRARDRLRSGSTDGIVIAKLDRLTRSVVDLGELIAEHFNERAGKQLFSVADAIDTRTPSGRLVLNILVSVAQWEREEIGRRTRDALQHKIARGERCGSLRYGHDLAGDGKTLTPNASEQAAIALMKALRANGMSLRDIAYQLKSAGIATKGGGPDWAPLTISRILKREASPVGQAQASA
jgi:site-specific DNA recombinase